MTRGQRIAPKLFNTSINAMSLPVKKTNGFSAAITELGDNISMMITETKAFAVGAPCLAHL